MIKLYTGGVRVIVDVGFYRDELNTDIANVDLCNGQQHVVNVKRRNRGRTLIIQVRRHMFFLSSKDLVDVWQGSTFFLGNSWEGFSF